MNLNPFQVGGTSQNWIGRSQYDADAYLDGQVDDLRIYSGALPAGEIYELAKGTRAPDAPAQPTSLGATAVPGNQINLNWSATVADYYNVKRAAQPDGPYYTVATLLHGTSYTDSGLTAGSTYYYVVTAANQGGESLASSPASAMALPPLPGSDQPVVGRDFYNWCAAHLERGFRCGDLQRRARVGQRRSLHGHRYGRVGDGVHRHRFDRRFDLLLHRHCPERCRRRNKLERSCRHSVGLKRLVEDG